MPDGWLRYVQPSEEDSNRSRWPVHPDWRVVQSAFPDMWAHTQEGKEKSHQEEEVSPPQQLSLFEGASSHLESETPAVDETSVVAPEPMGMDLRPYVRKRKRQENMRRMVAQIAGCTATVEAWREKEQAPDVEADISDTFHFLFVEVQNYFEEKERENRGFSQRVAEKRILYHVDSSAA